MSKNLFSILLFMLPCLHLIGQTTIWSEDFSTHANGTQNDPPKWTTQYFDNDDGANNTQMGQSYWGVNNGEFVVNDIEGSPGSCDNFWWSEAIDISQYKNVTITIDYRQNGAMEGCGTGYNAEDLIETSYRVDGGAWKQFCQRGLICADAGLPGQAKQADLAGNTVEIQIRLGNKANGEYYYFDNIVVTGETGTTPVPGADTVIYRCEGESAMIFGQNQTQPGKYFATLIDQHGCDSVAVWALVIDSTKNTVIDTSICEGDSIFLADAWHSTPGTYQDTTQSIHGCDQITTTQLRVLLNGGDTIPISICQGDSLELNNGIHYSSGIYSDTIRRQGCDSINFYDLTVYPIYLISQSFSICADDSVQVNGRYLKTSGTYRDTLPTINGCDSIIETQLTVYPTYDLSVNASICLGDSIFLDNAWQKNAGTFVDTFTTVNNCDSIVETQLSIIPPVLASTRDTICVGDSILLGGIYRKTQGVYRDTITSLQTGCDSVQLMQLMVENRTTQVVNHSICEGDSILLAGKHYKQTGVYSDTASGSCGAITQYNLQVLPTYSQNVKDTICSGASRVIGGVSRSTSGLYYDSLTTRDGCDSIIEIDLSVLPAKTTNRALNICANDSVLINGNYVNSSGIYRDTLQSQSGCDSILITDLQVNPDYLIDLGVRALCSGDSVLFAEKTLKSSGIYYDSLLTAEGCDSIIKIEIRLKTPNIRNQEISICEGDSILTTRGWRKEAGVFSDTIKSSNGVCDSLIFNTDLTVEPVYKQNRKRSICEGNQILIGGQWRSMAGTYYDTLQSSNGCDSIINIELVVYQKKEIDQTITICEGDTIMVAGTPRFDQGIYSDTLQSSEGCDSILQTTLNVSILPKSFNRIQACEGDTIVYDNQTYTTNDSIVEIIPFSQTCDSLAITVIKFEKVEADFSFEQMEQDRLRIHFMNNSEGATAFEWNFGDSSLLSDEVNPTHYYQDSGKYAVQLMATNHLGCSDSILKLVSITLEEEYSLFVPEIFTPNNDGINDFFEVGHTGNFSFEISIYNRWGELLFNSKNINFQWDGKYKGDFIPNGTYFYVVGGEFRKKGSITIIK